MWLDGSAVRVLALSLRGHRARMFSCHVQLHSVAPNYSEYKNTALCKRVMEDVFSIARVICQKSDLTLDLDEPAHNKPPHLHLRYLHSSF